MMHNVGGGDCISIIDNALNALYFSDVENCNVEIEFIYVKMINLLNIENSVSLD